MNKNLIIGVLSAAVVVLVVILLWPKGSGPKPSVLTPIGDDMEAGKGSGNNTPNGGAPLTNGQPREQGPVTASEVDRLPSNRVICSDFLVSGQGYYAKWGKGLKAGFQQKGEFVAEAIVVERKKLGNGRFKVVEDRTFIKARETLEIGEADYFFALDTLPIDEISSALDTVGKTANTLSGVLVSTAHPKLVAAGKISKTVGDVSEIVAAGFRHFKQSNNGKTLKELGVDVSQKANEKVKSSINDFARKPKEIETMIRKVEGRTYRFTYIQEGTGKPLNVTAERIERSGENEILTPLETEEEVWILCRCNAFIDAEFLKDKNGREVTPQPGVKWEVNARSVASIVGVDGYCKGSLTCCRTDVGTDNSGLWEFMINPAELDVLDDRGRNLGKISVGGGKSTVYADGRTLRDVTIKGKGKLNRVNKNSILFLPFNEKFIGDCHFTGKMTTEVK